MRFRKKHRKTVMLLALASCLTGAAALFQGRHELSSRVHVLFLKSKSPKTVARSALALGERRYVRAIPALLEVLEARHGFEVKDHRQLLNLKYLDLPHWAAARALGQMGPPAVPFLRRSLEREEARYMSLRAIGYLGPQAAELVPEVVFHVTEGSNSDVCRDAAVDALADIGNPTVAARDALLAALADRYKWVRASAIRSLLRLFTDDASVIEAVARLRNDPEDVVRKAVEEALGISGAGGPATTRLGADEAAPSR